MLRQSTLRGWLAVHKWTSLICTVFLLLLCVTGLPLIFHEEIDAIFDREATAANLSADTPDFDLDRIVSTGRGMYPFEYVRSLFWDEDTPHVVKLFVSASPDALEPARDHFISFDARTGRVLDERKPEQGFMWVMLELHEEMFAGLPGELFLGAMGLLFVVSLISGVVVYAPFMRKLAFGTIRREKSSRSKWLDLHNFLGIVTTLWLFVVGATGVMNTLSVPLFAAWRAQALPALLAPYRGQPMPDPASFGSVVDAVALARKALPDNTITSVVFPSNRFGSPRHYLVWTKGRTPVTSRLFTPVLVDVQTGALSEASGLPWYLRALELSRPLHFGDYGRLPLKIVWALFDLVAIVVLGSGVYLWLAKRNVNVPSEAAAAVTGMAP
jgi:uncharacterized iron-regulated membrane protein